MTFNNLTSKELYLILKEFACNDIYLSDYLDNIFLEDLLYLLETYEIIHILSNDRIILTQKGENLLYSLTFKVEL